MLFGIFERDKPAALAFERIDRIRNDQGSTEVVADNAARIGGVPTVAEYFRERRLRRVAEVLGSTGKAIANFSAGQLRRAVRALQLTREAVVNQVARMAPLLLRTAAR